MGPEMDGLISHAPGDRMLGRQDLLALETPASTETHTVVPHSKIVEGLVESLGFRKFDVVADQYAVNRDSNRMFGVLEINEGGDGLRFAIAVRNSHDRTFSLGLTVGYRVFCCTNLSFHGDFTPVTRKHSKNFDYLEVIDQAVGKMQRNFEGMRRQIDAWKGFELPDVQAKAIFFDAFVGRGIDAPQHIARDVAKHYFEPEHEDFRPRTLWSVSNAFTSAFRELEPIPLMRATASLAPFMSRYQ